MTTSTELEALLCQHSLPAGEVTRLVQELIAKQRKYEGDERRSATRYPVAYAVGAVPFDEEDEPGEAFAAITRDISSNGISIYHTQPVQEPYLAIQMNIEEGEQLRVLVKVVRSRSVGPFFYETGGIFVTRPAR